MELWASAGSSAVAAGAGGCWAPSAGSQNFTSADPMDRAEGRVAAKARHSAWQAVVMSSPFQWVGMRMLAAVQPGQPPHLQVREISNGSNGSNE